jgi:peptide/nickel transport system ATP-binding protein
MSTPAIEVRGLRREFRASQGLFAAPRRVVAVDDVSFSVPAGSVLGVVGESGCDKTTLARMILGLMEPSAGEVLVDGKRLRDIADLPLDMCIGDLKHTADFAHSPCLT